MSAPKRIQRRRTKGWRMPDGAVYVGRPSRWGNPFPLHGDWIMWNAVAIGLHGGPAGRREASVRLYRAWLTGASIPTRTLDDKPTGWGIQFDNGHTSTIDRQIIGVAEVAATWADPVTTPELPDLRPLRGRDLACWCPLDEPCHADVLLELANATEVPTP